MKIIFCLLLVIIVVPIYAHSDYKAQYIKGIGFEGYIFPKSNNINADWFPFRSVKERFTPTTKEIINAERILNEQLIEINKSKPNQGNGCPVIHENLQRFIRQYFGYINVKGESIIWINLVWNYKTSINLNESAYFILDGCSHYWNIKVNLKKSELFDLIVNGSA